MDILEDRTVLSTLSFPTAGSLDYVGTAGTASDLTVSTDGTNYTFTDADQLITLGASAITAGWSGSGTNTVTGPNSSVTGITITTSTAADTISIDSVDASTFIDSGAGNDAINVTANGVSAPSIVTIDSSSNSGSESLTVKTGGTPGTLATGAFGRENYQASGMGLIENASSKPGFADNFTGLAAAALTVNLNTLYTTPTALTTTISESAGDLEANVAGVFPRFFPIGLLAGISVGGTTAGESLTTDFTNGDPLPSSGLTYDPSAATGLSVNSLTLQGGSFTSETYTSTGAGAGSITYNGNKRITFSNLSPMNDTVPSATFTFTAPAGAGTVNVNTGPILSGVQTDQINDGGTGTFELMNFANKTAATVNVPASGATTTLNTPSAAAGLSALHVVSGAGIDTVDVQVTLAGVTTTVDTQSGAGSITNVGLAGSLGAIGGPLFVKSTGGSNTLAINDSAEGSGQTYDIAGSRVTGTSFPTFIDFSGGGITTLDLTSAGLGDTFNFTGPVQSDVTTYNFSADSGAGPNTLNINSSVPTVNYATPGVVSFGAGEPIINYTNFQKIDLSQPASPPVGTAVAINTTEGQFFNQFVVATFTENDPGNLTDDFIASINWGDGTPVSIGTIQPNGGSNGYNILGSHTYAEAGTFTFDVTLTYLGGGGTVTVGGTTIVVTFVGPVSSAPNPILSTAVVNPALLTAQGAPLGATVSQALTKVPVATFQDANPNSTLADFPLADIIINWGDGTPPTAASGLTATGSGANLSYVVDGSHTYNSPGAFQVHVLVQDVAGATANAFSLALVAALPPPPSLSLQVDPLSGVEGVALTANLLVGTFTDTSAAAVPGSFSATIAWGDGTTTTGAVSQPSGPGTPFVVRAAGGHTYAEEGIDTVLVTVTGPGTLQATASTVVMIADAPLTAGPTPPPIATQQGQSITAVIGSFLDGNPKGPVSDFTATIDWGDGSPNTVGTVTQPGGVGTAFQVMGSHTYVAYRLTPYPVTVSVRDVGGSTVTWGTTISVAPAPPVVSGIPVVETPGIQFLAPVAVILGANGTPAGPASAYSATINWGDGSATTNGTIEAVPGGVEVLGSHTYGGHSPLTITVTVHAPGAYTVTNTTLAYDPPRAPRKLTRPVSHPGKRAHPPAVHLTPLKTKAEHAAPQEHVRAR